MPMRGEVLRERSAAQARSTISGNDQHHPMPFGYCSSHRAGGEQRLIVRMGMHEHQGARCGVSKTHGGPIVSYGQAVRIAHISDCYRPRTGGIETQVRALALAQSAAGHQVHIVTATAGQEVFSGTHDDQGVTIHRIATHILGDLPVHPRTKANVLPILQSAGFDVVHVHLGAVSPFAWGALRAAKAARVPVVVTVHSIWGPMARLGYRMGLGMGHWSREVVVYSAVSETAAALVARALPAGGPVATVPNGIDASTWVPGQSVASNNVIEAVSVMRLAPRKRVMPLLRMLADAGELANVPLHLTVIGDGPALSRARRYARSANLPVVFAGRMSPEQVKQALAGADIFIQPSIKESFGIAALEARTMGVPVICRSQTGTTTFIQDQVHGLVVETDQQLSQAWARLADEDQLRDSIAERNRSTPPEQDWPLVVGKVTDLYALAARRLEAFRR